MSKKIYGIPVATPINPGKFSAVGKPTPEGGEIFNYYTEEGVTGDGKVYPGNTANKGAHAQNFGTHADGEYSSASGWNSTASGGIANASGRETLASGYASTTEGHSTKATGSQSHAGGKESEATSTNTFAHGYKAKATGNTSFAIGEETEASGYYAVASGYKTKASGTCSSASGRDTEASQYAANAEGRGTIANSRNQHVQGAWNVADTPDANGNGKYAHIVGGGTNANNRKNIHTLDWEGNAHFAGKIYSGGVEVALGGDGYTFPKLYGAVGDGVTDDTDAFQRALNSKKKLYVPNGTYKITGTLTAYNSVVFEKDAYIEFYPKSSARDCLTVSGKRTNITGTHTVTETKTDPSTGESVTETTTKKKEIKCTFYGSEMVVSIDEAADLEVGDYVLISNSELASEFGRDYDKKRDILQVSEVMLYPEGKTRAITFVAPPEYTYTSCAIDKLNMLENIIIDGVKIRCMPGVPNTLSETNGIILEYCKNCTVRNCHVSNFDSAQIYLKYCVLADAHSNLCEVNYAGKYQYGINVFSSKNITVYGNKVYSARTAIDVGRVSDKVTVTGNTVIGNIATHSSSNITITNNTIDEGMILIRGKKVIVSGNTVTCYRNSCIEIEEMGVEGGHIISNNIFKGYCSMRCYLSNITITGNHFIVEKVVKYGTNDELESVIRIYTAKATSGEVVIQKEGAVISGNTFDAVGITPTYCIEINYGLPTVFNLTIQDNVIHGFRTGINVAQASGDVGDNLIVKNNTMRITEKGIIFRHANNTQIIGNTIIGIGTEKGTYGIYRYYASVQTTGVFIKDNFVKNFDMGVYVEGVSGMKNTVYADNIFIGCENDLYFERGDDAEKVFFKYQQHNPILLKSNDGSIYHVNVSDDGTLSTEKKTYTE